MATKKVTLENLKVSELKKELEERECDIAGKKSILQQRLREALIQAGEDPDNYLFDTACDFNLVLQTIQENSDNLKEQMRQISDNLEEKMGQNSDNLEEKMRQNSDNLEEKMRQNSDHLEEKMQQNSDNLNAKIQEVQENHNQLNKEVDEKLESMEQKMLENCNNLRKEVENRFATLTLRGDDRQQLNEILEQGNINNEMELPKIRMKPPQFDGKTSWPNYLLQFEAAAKANGWSSVDKAIALTLALRGDATDILQTLSPAEQGNYQQLVGHLEIRYGQSHLEHVYHSQLKNRCQKSNETLQEFEADVARLVRLAYPATPENVMERLAVQAFLDGLRDNETKQALILARPTKLVDALARALEFEAAKLSSRSHARVRVLENNGDEQTDDIEEARLQKLVDKILSKKRRIQCWNCGKIGHVRSRCNERNKAPTSSSSEN